MDWEGAGQGRAGQGRAGQGRAGQHMCRSSRVESHKYLHSTMDTHGSAFLVRRAGSTRNLIIALSCKTLVVKDKSYLKEPSMFQRLRGKLKRTSRDEKRHIKLYRSTFFPLNGISSVLEGLMYDTILVSETFLNKSDISPNIAALISYEDGQDCLLRLHVYYSSNLTAGKEILLSGISFRLSTLIESNGLCKLSQPMYSEHCANAELSAFVHPLHPDFVRSPYFQTVNTKATVMNPMRKQYAFYLPDYQVADRSVYSFNRIPRVLCQEFTFEPRFSSKMPLVYLQNCRDEINRSLKAWKCRVKQEKMRQGMFENIDDALRNGWNELCVEVLGSKLDIKHSHRNLLAEQRSQGFFSWFSVSEAGDILAVKEILKNPIEEKTKATHPEKVTQSSGNMYEDISSYFDVSLETRDSLFKRKLARTNAEYYNSMPLYGTNLNADLVAKPMLDYAPHGYANLVAQKRVYEVKRSRIEFNISHTEPVETSNPSIAVFIPTIQSVIVKLCLWVRFEDSASTWLEAGQCEIPIESCIDTGDRVLHGSIIHYEKEMWLPVIMNSLSKDLSGEAMVLVKLCLKVPSTVFDGVRASHTFSVVDFSGVNEMTPETAPARVLLDCYNWSEVSGRILTDPQILSTEEEIKSLHISTTSEGVVDSIFNSIFKNESNITWRLDLPHTIDWMERHVNLMEQKVDDLGKIIDECARRVEKSVTFRSSALKKNPELQALPINLHGQVLLTCSLNQVGGL